MPSNIGTYVAVLAVLLSLSWVDSWLQWLVTVSDLFLAWCLVLMLLTSPGIVLYLITSSFIHQWIICASNAHYVNILAWCASHTTSIISLCHVTLYSMLQVLILVTVYLLSICALIDTSVHIKNTMQTDQLVLSTNTHNGYHVVTNFPHILHSY